MRVSLYITAKIKHSSLKNALPTTRLATIPPESVQAHFLSPFTQGGL